MQAGSGPEQARVRTSALCVWLRAEGKLDTTAAVRSGRAQRCR
jgi:hypothetical protein